MKKKVTDIQMQSSKLLGRTTAATGSVEEIGVSSGLSLTGGTLSIDSYSVSGSDIIVSKNIIPSTDITLSLGSATNRWKDIFVSANTIHIGDNTQISGTSIIVDASGSANALGDIPTIQASKIVAKPYTYNPGGGPITVRPSIEFQVGGVSYPISLNTSTFEFSLDAEGNYGTGSLVGKKITLSNGTATALSLVGNITQDGNFTSTQTDHLFRWDGNSTFGFDGANTTTFKGVSTFQGTLNTQGATNLGDGNDTVAVNAGASNFTVAAANFSIAANGNVSIAGNLTISGSTTTVNSNEVNIGDAIILLNADIPGGNAPTENAGLQIARGSSAASWWLWDETTDSWGPNGGDIKNVANLVATNITGALTGNASTATALQTARNINGVAFDGTSNITINAVDSTPRLASSAVSAFGLTLIDDADASAARTTLGLGTLSTQSGTFSGTSSGTNTGDQTITLTGPVTGTGTGSFATSITNNAVTNAMLAQVATATFKGRTTAATGNVEDLTAAQATALLDLAIAAGAKGLMSGADKSKLDGIASGATANNGTVTAIGVTTANGVSGTSSGGATPNLTISLGAITPASVAATGTVTGTNLSGTNTGDQTITLTGDVTGTGTGSFAATVASKAITLAKMADVATGTVFYRKTAATGVPEVQTLATLKTDLGLTGTNTGDQTITLTGDVTGSGTGSFAATLATVNSNVGAFGSASAVPIVTVNAKGLITAVSTAALGTAATQNTGTSGATIPFLDGVNTWSGANTFSAKVNTVASATGFAGFGLPHGAAPTTPVNGDLWSTTTTVNFRLNGVTKSIAFLDSNITGSAATLTTGRTISTTGDVTYTSGSFNGSANVTGTATIAANAVTLAKLAQVATATFLGRTTAATGNVEALTATQATALLDLAVAAGAKGLLSGADKTKLDGIASGATANSGTVTSVSVTTANGVSGSVATSTTTPAITLTLGAITPSSVAAIGTVTGTNLSGTNTGDQTITLTGDVTGSGTGSFAATVAAGAITLAKMANVATGTVFYRKTAATGAPEVQTLATLKTDLGLTGTNSGDQTITLTGDVTGTGTGSFAATLATVNSNVGSFGSATSVPAITVNAKGLITAVSTSTITAAGIGAIAASEKAAANGVATLGADSKIPTSQLPALAITSTTVAANQTAHLAVVAQEGDVVVRTDLNKSYIHNGGVAGTMADWQELLTPTDTVLSVAGKTGAVTLVKGDVGLGNVDNTSDAAKPVSTAQQTALDLKANLAGATFTGFTAIQVSGTPLRLNDLASGTSKLRLQNNSTDVGFIGANATGVTLQGNTGTVILQTASTGVSVTGTLSATGAISASNLSGTNTGDQTITLTGDVTGSGTGSFATTIANNVVTNTMLAQVNTATFKGRTTAATGNVEDLTVTQATAMLNTFSSTLKGLAPASGGGTTNFLRADGTWAAPAGGAGTVTSVSVTTANGVSGTVATATTTPAITLTLGAITPSSVTSSGLVKTVGLLDAGTIMARFEGTGGSVPAGITGNGVEIFQGVIQSYNRSTSGYTNLSLDGLALSLKVSGSVVGTVSSTGLAVTGALSVTQATSLKSTTITGAGAIATIDSGAASDTRMELKYNGTLTGSLSVGSTGTRLNAAFGYTTGLTVAGTDIALASSTGLAVTGAISATGSVTATNIFTTLSAASAGTDVRQFAVPYTGDSLVFGRTGPTFVTQFGWRTANLDHIYSGGAFHIGGSGGSVSFNHGALTSTGNITLGTEQSSAILTLGDATASSSFIKFSHQFVADQSQIFADGGGGLYYDSAGHYLRTGGSIRASVTSTGLAVTGTLSSTGALSAPGGTFTGGLTLLNAGGPVLTVYEADQVRLNRAIVGADASGGYIRSTFSNGGTQDFTIRGAAATFATFTTAGLSVTGTLSATGALSAVGGTLDAANTVNLVLRSSTASGSTSVAYMDFSGADNVRTGYVGKGSGSNSDIYVHAASGQVRLSATAGVISEGPLTVSGTLSATATLSAKAVSDAGYALNLQLSSGAGGAVEIGPGWTGNYVNSAVIAHNGSVVAAFATTANGGVTFPATALYIGGNTAYHAGNFTTAATFTSVAKGLAPASGGGTTNFLRADGTWAAPAGGSGTVTSVSVTTANGVSGTVATSTTTPAITLTLGAITPSSVVATGSVTTSRLTLSKHAYGTSSYGDTIQYGDVPTWAPWGDNVLSTWSYNGNFFWGVSNGGSERMRLNATGLQVTGDLVFPGLAGRGVSFYGADAYKIYMSEAANGTYGGRVSGETTSDYNIYLQIAGGGTNRGFVFKTNSGNVTGIDQSGNIRTAGSVTASSFIGSFSPSTITVSGTSTFNGNTYLGDSLSDFVTVSAYFKCSSSGYYFNNAADTLNLMIISDAGLVTLRNDLRMNRTNALKLANDVDGSSYQISVANTTITTQGAGEVRQLVTYTDTSTNLTSGDFSFYTGAVRRLQANSSGLTVTGTISTNNGVRFTTDNGITWASDAGVARSGGGVWVNTPTATTGFLGIGGSGRLYWNSAGVTINTLTVSSPIFRSTQATGYLSMGYGSSNSLMPIACISDAYAPSGDTTMGSMYGIGYSYSGSTSNAFTGYNAQFSAEWGLYTAVNGVVRSMISVNAWFANSLYAGGNITAGGTVTGTSDARLKTNVERIDNAREIVMGIEGVRFDWIDEEKPGRQIGFVAQNVQTVAPELIVEGKEHLSLAYGNMTAVHNEALKELYEENIELKARIERLEKLMEGRN